MKIFHIKITFVKTFYNKLQCFFAEKPANKENDLDIDWIPNLNLGRFSKNVKMIEYHLRKRTTTDLMVKNT